MGMRGGRDAEGGDAVGADDGWDLFGPHGLDAVAGLVGDGRDSKYVRGVDYTAAVRAAKSGERLVVRALRRVVWPGARVVTQSWSSEEGEAVVRVEMSADLWRRWVGHTEEAERCVRVCADSPLAVREVVRAQALFTPALRRAWARRPAAMVAAPSHWRSRG